MQYDEDFLRELNQKVNLADYVGNFIELSPRSNGDLYGKCPLHDDKTPSFSVNTRENLFYCFSCGRGGGIIQYLMKYEGLSIDEAVQKVCRLVKIDPEKLCTSETVRFLRKMKREASQKEVKHPILAEAEYLRYADEVPAEWLQEGISAATMKAFEVRVDNRANRIVYPVRNRAGELINIKGRTRFPNYKEMHLQKYINYKTVGTMDYFQGLHLTEPFIREKHEAIVFESIKSVMKCWDCGIKNTISAEKHDLTPEQIRLLISLRADVVLAYDSDVCYQNAKIVEDIRRLARFTNVYIIEDSEGVLGGKEGKNSPIDLGGDIFQKLYEKRRKVGVKFGL